MKIPMFGCLVLFPGRWMYPEKIFNGCLRMTVGWIIVSVLVIRIAHGVYIYLLLIPLESSQLTEPVVIGDLEVLHLQMCGHAHGFSCLSRR